MSQNISATNTASHTRLIVISHEEFALGMRLAGVRESYAVNNKEEALKAYQTITPDAFVIVTEGITELIPELKELANVVIFPDKVGDFSNISDLKRITRIAIGSEIEL
ncbi:MAG: V-type ATP synthase subunit F [Candidatus Woesearchaeota archaeon]